MAVEEIGQMWGPINAGTGAPAVAGASTVGSGSAGLSGSGSGGGSGGGAGLAVDPRTAVDPALSLLILRFATMIVLKVGAEWCRCAVGLRRTRYTLVLCWVRVYRTVWFIYNLSFRGDIVYCCSTTQIPSDGEPSQTQPQ